jgi:hypothetical protein
LSTNQIASFWVAVALMQQPWPGVDPSALGWADEVEAELVGR